MERRYGYVQDKKDDRDLVCFAAASPVVLPTSVNISSHMPPIYDQGQLGSCVANAVCAAVEFERSRQKLADFMPSRLFVYYNARALEGTIDQDAGAMIRDGVKTINWKGVCPERMMPYDITKFTNKPLMTSYAEAAKHEAVKYARVPQTLDALKQCLASGMPFVFGFEVYTEFESTAMAQGAEVLNLPGPHEVLLGGHAVTAVGYDDAKKAFFIRNSWGAAWGIAGHFWMSYDYIMSNLCSDFWNITLITA